jgi:RNA polymerase sigma-70 factor (ECF subfamily)
MTQPPGRTDADDLAESSRQDRFVMLLKGVHQRLLAYLVSMLANRHDAEDVLQRASITMWRKFDTFEAESDFMAWASTVAFYEARNFQRVASRSRLRFDADLLETFASERLQDLRQHDERMEVLQRCVQVVDEKSRSLIQAIYADGVEIAALAQKLGLAPQTLYNRIGAIRRELAEAIARRLTGGRA